MDKKILLVEDDPVGRQVISTLLRKNGYATILSSDVTMALAEVRKQNPDAIILDLGLPAGGGFTFLERLSSFPSLADIPVLVLSGKDRKTHEERALSLGAIAYLEKPATDDQILWQVRKLLGESST